MRRDGGADSLRNRRLECGFAGAVARDDVHGDVRLIASPDQMCAQDGGAVQLLELADDDEIRAQRIADFRDVTKWPWRTQNGRIADDREAPVRSELGYDRVCQPLRQRSELIVAAAVFDEDHVAALVTSCVDPLVRVAVAVNCDVAPIAGVVPVTLIADTVLADVAESLLQAQTLSASAMARNGAANVRIVICCLL